MPLYEYEPLVMFPKPKTSNEEEEEKGDTDGAKPSSTRVAKEPRNLIGGKDSPEGEVVEQTIEQE